MRSGGMYGTTYLQFAVREFKIHSFLYLSKAYFNEKAMDGSD